MQMSNLKRESYGQARHYLQHLQQYVIAFVVQTEHTHYTQIHRTHTENTHSYTPDTHTMLLWHHLNELVIKN